MKKENSKILVQKPFRCSEELNVSINKARGALLMKNGNKISENSFLTMLFEHGLAALEDKYVRAE